MSEQTERTRRARRALIYKETMRVLRRQSAVLDGLRNRAYILLTANSIVAALFAWRCEDSCPCRCAE